MPKVSLELDECMVFKEVERLNAFYFIICLFILQLHSACFLHIDISYFM